FFTRALDLDPLNANAETLMETVRMRGTEQINGAEKDPGETQDKTYSPASPDTPPPAPDAPWSPDESSSDRPPAAAPSADGPPLPERGVDPKILDAIEGLLASAADPELPRFVIYEEEATPGERLLPATPGWASAPSTGDNPSL